MAESLSILEDWAKKIIAVLKRLKLPEKFSSKSHLYILIFQESNSILGSIR